MIRTTPDALLMQLAAKQARAWLKVSPSWDTAYASARYELAKADERDLQGKWLRVCIALEVLKEEGTT